MPTVRPLLAASLLLVACQESPAGRSNAPTVAVPTTAAVSIRDGRGAEGPFRIGELQKLAIEVRLNGASPGSHPLRVDVLSPGGMLYAQLPVSVEAGPEGSGTATTVLEVGGTPIEGYRQVGAWTFRVSAPGAARSLAAVEAEIAD